METDAKPEEAAEPAATGATADDAAQPGAADGKAAAEVGGEAGGEGAEEDPKKEAAEPEPGSYQIANPARVVPAQEKFVAPAEGQRWVPVHPGARAGFIVLKDLRPGVLPRECCHPGPCHELGYNWGCEWWLRQKPRSGESSTPRKRAGFTMMKGMSGRAVLSAVASPVMDKAMVL